ncbi:hypothetical protein BegalDRAFT_1956 [Beggiatoa alba B18LD]|uniref:Uncharacterized protein n=1 Tax=Beggiatoa alba B18LD TaxID=395493 RepID=I3CGT5_9GAMM|nr:DsrE family protein [Beggiatoa alba]EIJ42828.1 hypothetical protein BegalDRAFT_1956 [Beggiatoa alba B18LD]
MLKHSRLIFLGLFLFFQSIAYVEAASQKVVIQVSSPDPQVQQLALNVATNLLKDVGAENIKIEIVAFGPGLSLFTPASPESIRVPTLAAQNVVFSACGNTINEITRITGRTPVLVQGVQVVSSGATQIIKLQEQGYRYLNP